MRIAMIAGELSGDILGAGLMRSLRARHPQAVFEGIGGPRMLELGFVSHYPLEMLSVMGLVEVLRHYPQLKRCHSRLARQFLADPPDLFIGIDAPDFNLPMEVRLRAAGIRTVHYVSPSVWAWREGRLKTIARACDLMLTLLPFEARYYQEKNIPVCYVGHPLVAEIPPDPDKCAARRALGMAEDGTVVALLPGSRRGEVTRLSETFIATARWLAQRRPDLRFAVPLANAACREIFTRHLPPDLPVTLADGASRTVMAAADAVLSASGTATLETLLVNRPLVIAYRVAPLTFAIAKRLVKIRWVGLPNLLAGELLVPEFLQNDAVPEKIGPALLQWLDNPAQVEALQARFRTFRTVLDAGGSERAAEAISSFFQT